MLLAVFTAALYAESVFDDAVARWRFDEGSGGMISDSSGNGNNLFIVQSLEDLTVVQAGAVKKGITTGTGWQQSSGFISGSGENSYLLTDFVVSNAEFEASVSMSISNLLNCKAAFVFGADYFFFYGQDKKSCLGGWHFAAAQSSQMETAIIEGQPFVLNVKRADGQITFKINGTLVLEVPYSYNTDIPLGIMPWTNGVHVYDFQVKCRSSLFEKPSLPKVSGLPVVDISADVSRQVVIAAGTVDVYQGHPTTVLMADNTTMFCVWTYGHGGQCGPLKKSTDAGLTWSGLLPVHSSWSTVSNCPSIYRMADAAGAETLRVFAQKRVNGINWLMQSYSTNGGAAWSPMASSGLSGLGMPFCSIVNISPGVYLGMTNVRRIGDPFATSNVSVQSFSYDGGATWQPWQIACDMPGYIPCEPFVLKSPDGKQLLCLMRENSRAYNSLAMVSNDQGKTWSQPWELAASLSGDRHIAKYANDGRLVCVFRDKSLNDTRHHFSAWVGTYEDIIERRQGQYNIKLMHNYRLWDCGYPGLEVLSDDTIVATTYLKYTSGEEQNSVICTRFKLEETDGL